MVVHDLEKLTALASEHKEAETVPHKLLTGLQPPESFEFCRRATSSLVATNVWLTSKGLLLGDDIGVGKTGSTLSHPYRAKTMSSRNRSLSFDEKVCRISGVFSVRRRHARTSRSVSAMRLSILGSSLQRPCTICDRV